MAYLTFPLGAHCSLNAGVLPTLFGVESTFTFQNANVLRGLLWNQENDVNRGIQTLAAAIGSVAPRPQRPGAPTAAGEPNPRNVSLAMASGQLTVPMQARSK